MAQSSASLTTVRWCKIITYTSSQLCRSTSAQGRETPNMVNTADLLARIRQRKQQLKSWEWWDTAPSNIIYQHIGARDDPSADAPIDATRLNLTKEERKRVRKLNRAEQREDERRKIELGIIEPPPPKISRRNVMAVFGAEYIQDPTKFEMMAKNAEDERHRAHLSANAERQLSKEEKWEKHDKRVLQHRDSDLHSAAFYAEKSLDSKQQYILDYTAKKFHCSGACIHGDQDTFIIFECGEPELQKIIKLVTSKFAFSLAWKGQLRKANFKRWSMHSIPDKIDFLKAYGVESIYEQAKQEYGNVAIN